jgi:hypothetical protein
MTRDHVSHDSEAAPNRCKNCGHERSDHSYDDGCWREIPSKGSVQLCSCQTFEPMTEQKSIIRTKATTS